MNDKKTSGPQVSNSEMDKGAHPGLHLQASYKAAIVITVLALGWMASGVWKNHVVPKDKTVVVKGTVSAPAMTQRVRTAVMESRSYTPILTIFGRTEAGKAVDVRVEITGRVLRLAVQKGDRVKAGDVLVRIDPQDRAERLAEAQARLKQRKIAYASTRKLSRGGYSSKLNVAQAKADLEAARAQVLFMKRELANTHVTAPFAGVVETLPVEKGYYFDKAGQLAARILDLATVKAVAQVAERNIDNVALGRIAKVGLPDGRVFAGKVTYIAKSSNALTRTFGLEVTFKVPDQSVAEGLTANIELPMTPIVGYRISPALLSLDAQGRIGVKTVNAQNIVEFHRVRLASDTAQGAWLTGLPKRIRIITVGQEFVRVGDTVTPVDGPLPSTHLSTVKPTISETGR